LGNCSFASFIEWSDWSECSSTCGQGTKERFCTNCPKGNPDHQTLECNIQDCPIGKYLLTFVKACMTFICNYGKVTRVYIYFRIYWPVTIFDNLQNGVSGETENAVPYVAKEH
jgi:hypothetical protein